MIRSHLSTLLGEKRWTQADLARATGIRPNTINALYHEFAERVNIEHVDVICRTLNCSVSDVFEYVPKRDSKGNYNRSCSTMAGTSASHERIVSVSMAELEKAIVTVMEKLQQETGNGTQRVHEGNCLVKG